MATPEDDGPKSIWLRPEPLQRAARSPLSRDRITAVAVAVADTSGLDAVSMRQVAAVIGCGTMSLYRYVRTKDELFELMADAVMAEAGFAEREPSGDWRKDLRTMAHARRAVVIAHPWAARLQAGQPRLGPHVLASIEFALAALDGLKLSTRQRVRMINTVNSFVHGFVQTELEERTWRRPRTADGGETWHDATLPYLQHILESGHYPRFTRMVEESESYPDPDAEFDWQLERVLDGLAAEANPPGSAAGARGIP